MEWEHKSITFDMNVEPLGAFFLASAKVLDQGDFIRMRSFAALGRTEEASIEMLKDQIRMKYRRVPETRAPARIDG